ncbi:MAG: NfeD family protein [Phenylobacterium sp.]|nr:MAG: NfeD family protein [Phenylobacterium sp.]
MDFVQDLFVNHPFWAWIALAAALLAIEVLTGSGWLLWPAASAGVTAIVAGFAGVSPAPAIALFAALTLATTFLGRRYMPRLLPGHGQDINDNVGRLVGHQGRVVAAFRDQHGRVFIDGKEWAAELADGDSLEAGARVEVVGVQGARLKVRGA